VGNCSNCGTELRPGANFCSTCGAAQSGVTPVETFEPDAAESAEPAPAGRPEGGTYAAASGGHPVPPKKIEDHLIKSIIATICCCLPLGIVGIVYAAKADALLRKGNRAAAEEAGKKAGLWSNLAIGEGVVINSLAFMLAIIYRVKELL
jgi:hypothetical protein